MTQPETELNLVPIPIRPGLVVKVQLPYDLTAEEAEKIARVVVAHADTEIAEK